MISGELSKRRRKMDVGIPAEGFGEITIATGKELDRIAEQYGMSSQSRVGGVTIPTTPVNNSDTFLGTKFFVGDAAQSKAIQDHLFNLGFSWYNSSTRTRVMGAAEAIFVTKAGVLNFCTCERAFHASGLRELTFVFRQEVIQVVVNCRMVAPPRETFLYEGKKYFKDELDKAFSSLTPVPTDWIR